MQLPEIKRLVETYKVDELRLAEAGLDERRAVGNHGRRQRRRRTIDAYPCQPLTSFLTCKKTDWMQEPHFAITRNAYAIPLTR
jgi:hypothetical protein